MARTYKQETTKMAQPAIQNISNESQNLTDQITNISNYLKRRPIATILQNCKENHNLTVLRFLCILDCHMEENNLYLRIRQSSCSLSQRHLLSQLLNFKQFETFQYFDYRLSRKIRKNVLKCIDCNFVGFHGNTLTHMAICHGRFVRKKMCLYCYTKKSKIHSNESIEECYQNYIREDQIDISHRNICSIAYDFYKMLRDISKKLGIYKTWNKYFTVEQCPGKSIQSDALDDEFNRVISFLFGGNGASRLLLSQPAVNERDTIVINSDDEETRTNAEHKPDEKSVVAAVPGPSIEHVQRTIVGISMNKETELESALDSETNDFDDSASSASSSSSSRSTDQGSNSTVPASASSLVPVTSSNPSAKSDSEKFGNFVTDRLDRLPDDLKRRKLENIIQKAIWTFEEELLE